MFLGPRAAEAIASAPPGAPPRLARLPRLRALPLIGAPVAIDVSWLFGLTLGAWTLADTILPQAAVGRSALAYWAGGGAASLLLLASVAGHELAHCRSAQRHGLSVTWLHLSLLGGVTEVDDVPRSPREEFRLAMAGPVASLGMALAAAVAHVVMVETGADPLAAAVPAVVAAGNILLAVLNLAPGLPLDGGRAVRAVVWAMTGDPARATRVAAGLGRGLAVTLIAIGVIASTSGDTAVGLWAMLLGGVVYRGVPAD